MKKLKLFAMVVICGITLAACGGKDASSDVSSSTKESTAIESSDEKLSSEVAISDSKKSENKKTDAESDEKKLGDELLFGNFTVKMNEAKVYEKDGSKYINFRLTWTNDSFPGEKSFMSAVLLDVFQGEDVLEEKSGLVENMKSNFYYKNKVGIEAPISFTYELSETDEPVKLVFVPMDEYDENQEYLIDIK